MENDSALHRCQLTRENVVPMGRRTFLSGGLDSTKGNARG